MALSNNTALKYQKWDLEKVLQLSINMNESGTNDWGAGYDYYAKKGQWASAF